jgi:hypothetical protein
MKMSNEIKAGLDSFMELIDEREMAYRVGFLHNSKPNPYYYKANSKYTKIIEDHGNQRMVFGFVDNATGDIYKAAGWNAPAKHARGNVLVDRGVAALSGVSGDMPSIRYL